MPWFHRTAEKRRGLLLSRPLDNSERCRDCGGACCRSFTAVPLTWEEFERLQALGARRLQLNLWGPPVLLIDAGCEFLTDGRCRIYPDRPDVCRRFACQRATQPKATIICPAILTQ